MSKILIIDKMHESLVPGLEGVGYEVVYKPSISRQELLKEVAGYIGLIVRSKTPIDEEVIEAATNLRFVARAGAGLDLLDVDLLGKKGIHKLNAPEGNRDAVGEHALGLLLNLLARISVANSEIIDGHWNREQNRGFELKGKTVGIYGYGNTGSAFAKKLSGLDCNVLAYDKFKKNYSDHFVEEVSLEQLKEQIEILSLHVPLDASTKEFFSEKELMTYKNLKIIINTARGGILPLDGLIKLLNDDRLLGAGLDVLENEKISELSENEADLLAKLNERDNVIITPHVAGWTKESYERINHVLIEKIADLQII